MTLAVDVLGSLALAVGSFFLVVGAVGMLRFPDFFSRLHGASVTDTLGTGLIILGLCLEAGWSAPVIKLVFILIFLWFTGPVATHALAKAALRDGVQPLTADRSGRLRPQTEEDGSSSS